jgi:hypothetical protein
MRREMHSYIQTRLADFSDCRTAADLELTQIGALKTLLSEVLVMTREQRVIRHELCKVQDSLLRFSLSGCAEAAPPPTISTAPGACPVGIAKTCSFKAPGSSAPAPCSELGEEELSSLGGRDVLQVLPFFSPATLLAAVPDTASTSATEDALVLSARRPRIHDAVEALGLSHGWATATTMQDHVVQGAGTVKSAVDTLTVEVTGLVSKIWRVPEVGSDFTSSLAAQPLRSALAKATPRTPMTAYSLALKDNVPAVQEEHLLPSLSRACDVICTPGLQHPPSTIFSLLLNIPVRALPHPTSCPCRCLTLPTLS